MDWLSSSEDLAPSEAPVRPLRGSPIVVADAILSDFESATHLRPQSFDAMALLMRKFARFCERGLGHITFEDVTHDDALRFIHAPTRRQEAPAVNTQHQRRCAVSLLYRRGRLLGLLASDPTLDIRLPPRSGSKARALEDDEIELAREWARDSRASGHRAPVWALAEAGGHQGEISRVEIEDLDLARGTVTFRGGSRGDTRCVALTAWGVKAIADYLRRTGSKTEGELLQIGNSSASGRASTVGMTLIAVLKDSGLRDRDVKPRSIIAWRAKRLFHETGEIEAVARVLGMRSLDAAARLIDYDWRGTGP